MKNLLHSRFYSDYGSLLVLLALCVYYSFATLSEQHPVTPSAGRAVAEAILNAHGPEAAVLIVVRDTDQDRAFAQAIRREIESAGATVVDLVAGDPVTARQSLERLAKTGTSLDAVASNEPASVWGPLRREQLDRLSAQHPALGVVHVYKPASYVWPSFLTRANLLNVVNQNADIAIIAIGMTMVIITAGIDLSVGSLLALSGVVTAIAVHRVAGGQDAGTLGLVSACLIGIGVCLICGTFNGLMVTWFRMPAFVVTLGMMMIARGLALILAVRHEAALAGGATEGTPEAVQIAADAFAWLGNGVILGVPNPVLLMLVLYILAHVVMTRTSLGRYIYAVGGNPEAARLSGVPVFAVLILVYAICGAMAGLGGVVDASRFQGGRPNAGELYELRVIAAVVVGGTSLAGGEGRIFGTLIGALIIAVIQNGLNMAGVKSYEQMVVFGLLIIAAVLLDQLKKGKWGTRR